MSRIKLEDIQDICNADGWSVISDNYINLKTIMQFECPEGHRVFDTWDSLRDKRICPTCLRNTYRIVDESIVPKSKGIYRILVLD